MYKLRIEGGQRLTGEVTLQGAKNSALPIIAASLMVKGKTVLHNCPDLSDVDAALKILEAQGCVCNRVGSDIYIDASFINCHTVPETLMREMLLSVVFLGAILSRCGKAVISTPGGCELGPRPIDLHLGAISQIGYSVEEIGGYIHCQRESFPSYTELALDFPSVGATENIILASCLSKGTVVLHNAAREPEIADLAEYLNKAGGKVIGAGTDTIEIVGVKKLSSVEHTVIPDRIVAATYMSAAAITEGSVLINNINAEHMRSIIKAYEELGCNIKQVENQLKISMVGRPKKINVIRSTVYPGFPTDAGPLLVATLTKAQGASVFVETIFENRFNYIDEMRRLGADVKVYNRVATVEGVSCLRGAKLSCTDLRGGAAMIVAALAADGVSEIDKMCHVERGYENFHNVLKNLSAKVDVVEI